MDNNWLEIGTVVGAQGLKGELRIYSSSDFPERFEKPGRRWLQNPTTQEIQQVELVSGRNVPGKNLYVVTIENIEDRSRVETLKGYKLLIKKSDRLPLEEDEYHVSDLVGLEVYDRETAENIGVVIEIYSAGNDLLEVKLHKQPTIVIADSDADLELKDDSSVRKTKKKKTKLPKPTTVFIPFVKEIVPVVDLQNNRIEIIPPPGLLQLESN
jgi:16S rRNA processing protein RimM